MSIERRIRRDYFEWMYDLVCGERYPEDISFRKLLTHLHEIDFVAKLPLDADRGSDGLGLRYKFVSRHLRFYDWDDEQYLDGPCSVLEMMIALAIRCEETMDDPDIGDRTAQWFWQMIVNLGLGSMADDRYDEATVEYAIQVLIYRDYEPDGRGGLFTVKNARRDMRDVEIWYQMWWYIETIT